MENDYLITQALWTPFDYLWQHPIFNETGAKAIVWVKKGANLVEKSFLVLIMSVWAVITPIFGVLDMIFFAIREKLGMIPPDKPLAPLIELEPNKTYEDEAEFMKNIAVMFPTKKKSYKHLDSPVVDDEYLRRLPKNSQIKEGMKKNFDTFLKIHGLRYSEETVYAADDFFERGDSWLYRGSKDYKKIVRVMESLNLHGLEDESGSLYFFLQSKYDSEPEIRKKIDPIMTTRWMGHCPKKYFFKHSDLVVKQYPNIGEEVDSFHKPFYQLELALFPERQSLN